MKKTSISVKHWGCYELDGTVMTHQFDLADNRETSGQIDAWLGSAEGAVDDFMGITMEVGTDPVDGLNQVPALHVHFDGDNLACSFFKRGEQLLLRLEEGVRVEHRGKFHYLVREDV